MWTAQGGVKASRSTDGGQSRSDITHRAQTVSCQHLWLEGDGAHFCQPTLLGLPACGEQDRLDHSRWGPGCWAWGTGGGSMRDRQHKHTL